MYYYLGALHYHCHYCGKCFGLINCCQWHTMYYHLALLYYHCHYCGKCFGSNSWLQCNDTLCPIALLHCTILVITVENVLGQLVVFNDTQCTIIT